MARRHDQDNFDKFTLPLEELDHFFESFAKCYGFILEKNPLRKPGRMLSKIRDSDEATIDCMIGLYLEPPWYGMEFDSSLPYTFVAGAYLHPKQDSQFKWRLFTVLENGKQLSWMNEHLEELLSRANSVVDNITAEEILEFGEKSPYPIAIQRT